VSSYVKVRTYLRRFPENPGIGRNCRQPLDFYSFPPAFPIYLDAPMSHLAERATTVRKILASRGLSLYQVSQRSSALFGRSSPFCIPHNLYSELKRTAAIPTIHQFLALSHITNYRLGDWFATFGVGLDAAFGLQLLISRRRTVLLDSTVYDPNAWIPWFAPVPLGPAASPIIPLRSLLGRRYCKRASEFNGGNGGNFRYARIGAVDVYAAPTFVPGSIVRVDVRRAEEFRKPEANATDRFYLLEHERGWTCSQLKAVRNGRVRLLCPPLPCAERELEVGDQARVLGVIDAEIRPMNSSRDWRTLEPDYLPVSKAGKGQVRNATLGRLIRGARQRAGLSFREASTLSRLIATKCSDELYFTAGSTLSDYEVLSGPPRHVQKILTLCLLYAIPFERFLRAAGLPLEKAGRESMAAALLGQEPRAEAPDQPGSSPSAGVTSESFLAGLASEWEEVPLFLRAALDEVTGCRRFSISDLFWLGNQRTESHLLLADASLAAVNRRSRKPPRERPSLCPEPLYLLLKRDGSYACGYVTREDRILTLHDGRASWGTGQRFREDIDAEVIGRVSAILRRFR
jgi:hypothetical protein